MVHRAADTHSIAVCQVRDATRLFGLQNPLSVASHFLLVYPVATRCRIDGSCHLVFQSLRKVRFLRATDRDVGNFLRTDKTNRDVEDSIFDWGVLSRFSIIFHWFRSFIGQSKNEPSSG